MKPLIVMTGAHKTVDGLTEHQFFHNYAEAVAAAGGFSVLALDGDESDAAHLAARSGGLLLTGGVDVNPRYYGETPLPACGAPDALRDRLELILIQAFLNAGRPIFGVCRGFQMINVAFGGSLYQDIPTQLGKPHTYNSVHSVTAVPGSLVSRLFGESFVTNSLHHQAIRSIGKGLLPAAHSEGGAITEAFVHESLPVLAVQWHPERMTGRNRWTKDGPDMTPLFGEFVGMCSRP